MALLLNPRDQYISDAKAPQACGSCKRQKRKCDKALPSCGLCTRLERSCDYAEPQKPAPTAEDFAALQLKLFELEGRLKSTSSATPSVVENGVGSDHSGPSSGASMSDPTPPPASVSSAVEPLWEQQQSTVQFPPDVFLDIVTHECLNQSVPKPFIDIPADVLDHLGDGIAVQTTTGVYFATVHTWLPIISKKRMLMGVTLGQGGPDLAMLFLAMKLMIAHPAEGLSCAQLPIYRSAKRFASILEHSGVTSLMALQSMVLIAYFEYAHGIYPAAWMTIGSCVRYGDLLGLPGFHEGSILLRSPTTWTELEERKRTWWAILVLDRFICIGNKKRYLSPEPLENESFPVDDKAWDDGRVDRAVHHRVSSPFSSTPSSPFSSLCHSALLTGQVLQHVRNMAAGRKQSSNAPSGDPQVPDVTSLSSTLTSALGSLPKDIPFLAARCVLMSNAILLHDFYCCPANPDGWIWSLDETEQQVRSFGDLRNLSREIAQLASEILLLTFSMEEEVNEKNGGISVISPLVLDALYGAANTLAWLAREEGSAECEEAVETIKRCLSRLGARWRLAGEYGRMLEQQAFAYMMQEQRH